MQRYHDFISSLGGKKYNNAYNRPLLVIRANLCAPGYPIDGAHHTKYAQHTERDHKTKKPTMTHILKTAHDTYITHSLDR